MKKLICAFAVFAMGFVFAGNAAAATQTITVVSGADKGIKACGPLSNYAGINDGAWSSCVNAVATWKHPSWPMIDNPDAVWISSANKTESPADQNSWRKFSVDIEIPICATITAATLEATSDNAEEVYLNGVLIGSDGEVQGDSVDNQEWNTIIDYSANFKANLTPGTNKLQFIVRNYAGSANPEQNPTGLIFAATVEYNDAGCSCTTPAIDEIPGSLGVNRHIWNSGDNFTTLVPKGKGSFEEIASQFTLADTRGCSCTQILDILQAKTGGDFEGHRKFGCSKSIIEDWISGEYYLETVSVPVDQSVVAAKSLIDWGNAYILKASGTYKYANWAGNPRADAKCSYRGTADPLGHNSQWLSGDLLPAPHKNYLETRVNGGVVDWGVPSGVCAPDNKYQMEISGANQLNFNIFDGGAIGDNTRIDGVDVSIYVKLW